jgi:putative ABC transport system permease protein
VVQSSIASPIRQDIRFGLRMLCKDLGFTLVAILSLALGIGGNVAIFSITSALLLRALPYQHPQQLMDITVRSGGTDRGMTLLRYELLRDHSQSFDGVAVYANDNFNLTGHGEPLQVPVSRVSPNLLSMLGVRPGLGRTFVDEEGRPEGKPVVMITDALWHSRFGADPQVVGQTVALDGVPHTIVGVLRGDVQFPFMPPADIWTPRYFEYSLMSPQRLRMGVGYLNLLTRLKPDTTVAQANAELSVLNQQYNQQNPNFPDAGADRVMLARPLRELIVGNVRTGIFVLSGAIGLVLLIACANVANLLLSRGLARKKEIAVRTALGATRFALVRQLLIESVLLSLVSGVLGLGLGYAAMRYFAATGNINLPAGVPITMDASVLAFCLALSILTGVLFGIIPALQLSRSNVNQALRDEGRGATIGHRRTHLNGLLVVSQVAISLLLLIGAGLLLRSFSRLLHVDPGFDSEDVLTMNVSLPTVKYSKPDQQTAFFDELLRKVTTLPGVRSAAISAALPLTPKRITPLLPEGQPDVPLPQRPFIDVEAISPQWFQTMRVPLLAGRQFSDADNAQSPKVVIVNQTFARQFWPRENPIGKHIIVGRGPQPSEVVGVAADVKNLGLAQDTQPQLYLPFPQLSWGNMNLIVRAAVEPHTIVSSIRAQISQLDPDQPVMNVQTVDELMDSSRAQPRFTMVLLAIFSGTALVLAIVGIYGVLAYSVAQRRQELGVRLALGAQKSDILRLIVGQGLTLVAAGIVIGLVAALGLTRLMGSLLYKVGKYDASTFSLVPLLFLIIALVASYLPARRATKVDPTEALRNG